MSSYVLMTKADGDRAHTLTATTLVTSKNRFSNQPLRLSECDLSEAYRPEGHPLSTSKPQEDAFAVKRGSESAVSSICTILHTSYDGVGCGTRFRSELASICVSEAEAFTSKRECSSASFLLVFHAIGFALALKTKHRIGRRGALTVTTLSRFRSRGRTCFEHFRNWEWAQSFRKL